MEDMAGMKNIFGGIYRGKKVLVTGHTGFKGSWLTKWLQLLGADVYGISLAPPSVPNHISLLQLNVSSQEIDIRDLDKLKTAIASIGPEIVFHLAAQALVRASYSDPIGTFTTNVIGTVNLFEACRNCDTVKAIVNVTSDKCYENKEWVWGYRENDPLGGFDPYSASKGCSEIVTASFRNSFFNLKNYSTKHQILLASGRAGNVIGGGDWAEDRLVPDMVRAAAENVAVMIRSPRSTRPWQHVLEPLSGYLTLGWKLLENKPEFADAWNFGPGPESNLSVEELFIRSKKYWGKLNYSHDGNNNGLHEAGLLMLDCSKANCLLKWRPVWNLEKTLETTFLWYKKYYEDKELMTVSDITCYVSDATKQNQVWTI